MLLTKLSTLVDNIDIYFRGNGIDYFSSEYFALQSVSCSVQNSCHAKAGSYPFLNKR